MTAAVLRLSARPCATQPGAPAMLLRPAAAAAEPATSGEETLVNGFDEEVAPAFAAAVPLAADGGNGTPAAALAGGWMGRGIWKISWRALLLVARPAVCLPAVCLPPMWH